MTPAASEAALIADYSLIPDPHERMSAIVASCAGPGMAEDERRGDDLVPGCVSRVWLAAREESGALRLRWEADSPLVKGMAGLVCRVYEGAAPADAAAHESNILAALGFDRQLSPTRLNGLTNVAARIRQLAAALT